MFSIYRITNISNGKVYIGKTSRDINQRLREHIHDSRQLRNRCLAKAIRKYGRESFIIETIRLVDNEQEANWLESLYIGLARSTQHEYGYNGTFGGEGVVGNTETNAKISAALKGRKPTTEQREKLRIARRGRTPALGMRHTEEWCKNHSQKMTGENHPLFGKHHSPETKQRISAARKGRSFPRLTLPMDEVTSLYLDGKSTRQIAHVYNVDKSTIRRYLNRIGVKLRPSNKLSAPYRDTEVQLIYGEGLKDEIKKEKRK